MKKILFGSASAICTVTGLSSFKANSNFQVTHYWFHILPNIIVGNAVAPNDASFAGTTDPSGIECPASVTHHYKCMITVTVGKVTANHTHLNQSVSGGTRYTRTGY